MTNYICKHCKEAVVQVEKFPRTEPPTMVWTHRDSVPRHPAEPVMPPQYTDYSRAQAKAGRCETARRYPGA